MSIKEIISNKWNSKRVQKIIRKPRRMMRAYKEGKIFKEISGIVHVGANRGQESALYAKFDLDVLWVEPIPEVYEQLVGNIKKHKKQKAIQALITDVDDQTYQFNIANNNGASSSILQLKEHKEIWPHVHFNKTISLQSITLSSLYKQQKIAPTKYQALVMDTQGSELLVLKGSLPLLKYFKFIKTEVADFEAYEGCCQLNDINEFMVSNGFKEYFRQQFAKPTKAGGKYFNVIYVSN